MQASKKAVFVGITYEHMQTNLPQPLERIPYIYAKKLKENLVLKGAFTDQECEIFTDWTSSFALPTKSNVMQALNDLISNANKSGDHLLFYFCGHGVAYQDPSTKQFIQRNGNWGSLKTLKPVQKKDTYLVDEFFDTEFQAIIGQLHAWPKVNLTILIHACHGGVMFVSPNQTTPYQGNGIALSAVDPSIPAAIENPSNTDFSTRRDFTTFLIDDVVKKFPADKAQWPTYEEVYGVLSKRSSECPTEKGDILKPVMYVDPKIDPAKLRFLES